MLKRLDKYEQDGLLDASARTRLQAHLRQTLAASRKKLEKAISLTLWTFASLVIVLGACLLIWERWEFLSDTARLTIGFVPLVASGVMALRYFLKRPNASEYWRQIIPLTNIAGVITAIFVYSNVYQLAGTFSDFMCLSVLLTVFLPFIFNSRLAATANIVMVFFASIAAGEAIHFYSALPLILFVALICNAVFIFGGLAQRRPDGSYLLILPESAFIVFAPIAVSVNFYEHSYSSSLVNFPFSAMIFALFYGMMLAVLEYYSGSDSSYKSALPKLIAGFGAFFVFLCYSSMNNNEAVRLAEFGNLWLSGMARTPLAYSLVLIAPALLLFFHALFLIKFWRKKDGIKPIGILSACCFSGVFVWLFSGCGCPAEFIQPAAVLICLTCGLAFVIESARKSSIVLFNIGLLMLILLTTVKLVERDYPIVIKAVALILLGLLLIAVNRLLFIKHSQRKEPAK